MKGRLISKRRYTCIIGICLCLCLLAVWPSFGATSQSGQQGGEKDSDHDSVADAQEQSSGNPGPNNLFPGHVKMLQGMKAVFGSSANDYIFSTCLVPGSPPNNGPNTLYGWDKSTDITYKYYQEPYLPQEYWKPANRASRDDVFSSTIPRVLGIMNYDRDVNTDIHKNPMAITSDPGKIGVTAYDDRAIFEGWNFIDLYVSGISWCDTPTGAISVPTPQEIMAAHKNGVPVLSSAFFMQSGDPTWESDLVSRDSQGNLWAIDKMVELANAFHFDGWFFNCETSGISSHDASAYEDLMKGLTDKGMIVVWYDSMSTSGDVSYQNELNKSNVVFLKNSSGFFANYGWNQVSLDTSRSTAGDRSGDVYMGVIAWVPPDLTPPINIGELYDYNHNISDKSSWLSLGLWAIAWPCEYGDKPSLSLDVIQQNVKAFWWCKQFPNNPNGAQGMGDYFTPKTAITELPFSTSFNLGKGNNYFSNGNMIASGAWGNLTEQDLLPHYLISNDAVTVGFNLDDAWNGGSSLEISSSGGTSQDVPIYLAAIDEADYSVTVTYKNAGSGTMVFYVKDSAGAKQTVVLSPTGNAWNTVKIAATGSIYELGVTQIGANSDVKIGAIDISD
jgi:endo-beta-N-acetylglucosaminidase D